MLTLRSLLGFSCRKNFCTNALTNEPSLTRNLNFPPVFQKPRQVWVENIDTPEEKKLSIIDLHPDVFGTAPRIDIIHQNITWQRKYRYVSFAHTKTRAEVRGQSHLLCSHTVELEIF